MFLTTYIKNCAGLNILCTQYREDEEAHKTRRESQTFKNVFANLNAAE